MKKVVAFTLLAGFFGLMSGCSGSALKNPVSMHWKLDEAMSGAGKHTQVYSITNKGKTPLEDNWTLYFTQLPYIPPVQGTAPLDIEMICSSYYSISPSANYRAIGPGETVDLAVSSYYEVFKDCQAPEGAFIVFADGGIHPVEITADPIPLKSDGKHVYDLNALVGTTTALTASDIIPQPKKITASEGELTLTKDISIEYPGELSTEARLLKEKLESYWDASVGSAGKTKIRFSLTDMNPEIGNEGYSLAVSENGIRISANTPAGIFYGTQTLLSILKGAELPARLSAMTITDYPDFAYRGQMLDIVRTYIPKDRLFDLVDIFASYKLNTLHLHFSDDEGWRIAIPGLEELTEVGARRGYTTDERDMLYPAYDGGYDGDKGAGTGHLTREDFIELLVYASERHMSVIPEIESPGHARAAIKAMEARYYKHKDTDIAKAEEYLLNDFDDTSEYLSAQLYTDNVMCVGLPSVYRFMEKVVDELVKMYGDAGLTLDRIHVGGDEVPEGSWTGSPVCSDFMRREGIAGYDRLAEYYILRVNDILKAHDIRMGGWQEIVEGRSEEFRLAVKDNIYGVYCWSTIGRNSHVPYHLANLGYKVILSNVTNLYYDMAYTSHPEEPGHWWGTFMDYNKSFALQPFNIYASVRFDNGHNPVDVTDSARGQESLTAEGVKNIEGIQGQLWAEVIRGTHMTEYQLFPKAFGLFERGWDAHTDWAAAADEQTAFRTDFNKFNQIVTLKEMPWLAKQGINFRIPQPGLYVSDGMLYANSRIEGAEIRYTTDGSQPDRTSALWTEPVACDSRLIKARLFYLGKESVTTLWKDN